MDRSPVTHNEAKGQFEIALGNESAVLQYHRTQHSITLIHTEVPEPWRGRGLGDQLIRAALDYAHFNQLKVVPVCPFVKAYLKKHPETATEISEAIFFSSELQAILRSRPPWDLGRAEGWAELKKARKQRCARCFPCSRKSRPTLRGPLRTAPRTASETTARETAARETNCRRN